MKPQVIIIVGGGFGGIKTALELDRRSVPNTKIVLISDKPHFEYHATLYRVLTGKSPLEVCIPLTEIFKDTRVEILQDRILDVDLKAKKLSSHLGFHYKYDYLILSLGSQINYYNTEGLEKYSFNISSISHVLKLKNHIHNIFEKAKKSTAKVKKISSHFVIVGGGVTGCETAGELSKYLKKLAVNHGIDPNIIKIDLIHSGSRLIPMISENLSLKVEKRLKDLNVNVILDKQVTKEEAENIYLKKARIKSKTLIWTAGVKINDMYRNINGIEINEKNKVSVNLYLQAKGYKNVFIIGDAISDKYPGMAQTALNHGEYVAYYIDCKFRGIDPVEYISEEPIYAIPVGSGWAATKIKDKEYVGRTGWFFRKMTDLKFFTSILPLTKAFTAYRSETQLWENCSTCVHELKLKN